MSDALAAFRVEIDDFFGSHPQSPIPPADRAAFRGLDYYAGNEAYRLTVEVTRLPDGEPLIEMDTTTGERRLYRRWGTFTFTVEGQPGQLTIYSDPDGEEFFLPFKDRTNGVETYGAGRYLDDGRPGMTRLNDTQFEVDFNYAYNPWCVYSAQFSCPLPPAENWLKIKIRAGEKDQE